MMKKITFLFALLTVSFGFSQSLPFDFSDANEIFSFGGSTATMVTDPGDSDEAANPSNDVMQIDGGAGAWDNVTITLAERVDLSQSANNTITFRIKPTADYGARSHLLKFEGGMNGTATTELGFNTVAGTEWQEISLDFDNATVPAPGPGDYDKIFIFTDAGSGAQGVYLIDNLAGGVNIGAPAHCSNGVEDGDETGIDCGGSCFDVCTVTTYSQDFESGSTGFTGDSVSSFSDSFSNPEQTGINSSSTCAQIDGINVGDFSNAQVTLSSNLDFSAGDKGFRLMIQGPRAIPVKLKVEGAGAQERDANYTDVGNWQELYFDFTSETSTGWNKIVIFFEISTAPSVDGADDIFLFDNLEFGVFASLSTKDIKNVEFKTFPNPTQDRWTVKTQSTNIKSIRLYDVLGKNVMSLSPNRSEAVIEAYGLNKGLYFAKIETDSGTSSLKLIKQ